MKSPGTVPAPHLTLDDLVVSWRVARCLPPRLAFRYHALPVGKANGRTTVAMANPDDMVARQAIADALNTELYVVQGDQAAIDRHLAELWPQEANQRLRLLVYPHISPYSDEVQAYAQYLTQLLEADLTSYRPAGEITAGLDDLAREAAAGYNLIVFGDLSQSLIGRLLSGPADCKAVAQLPASVLIARCPRWPLKKILLITRGQGLDDVAVTWILRLAKPGQVVVTVLAVQPPIVGINSQILGGLDEWLATDTPLGRQLRQIAGHLVNWEIEGKLRFRQGLPDWQIKCEITEGSPDLVILAANPADWWRRRLMGNLVDPLLGWIDRPVLVAKPET